MKFFYLITLSLILSSCGSMSEQESEGVINGEWLELPMPEGIFAETESFQMQTYEIVVPANDWIETKIEMDIGNSIVYHWELIEDENTTETTTDAIYTEFHGHAPRVEGELAELMFYRKATGGSGQGTFSAPFSGIHGWFIDNTNDHDIVVRVQIAGEFSLYN